MLLKAATAVKEARNLNRARHIKTATPKGLRMSDNWVLKEDEAVELLALLITSARIQLDEPAHYGPLRLLTATERLSGMILERASEKSRAFLQDNVERIPELHMRMADVDAYADGLDALCREVAECLLRHSSLTEEETPAAK